MPGTRVRLDDVLAAAHTAACRDEQRADVRAVLQGWPDVRTALAAGAPVAA